MNGGPAGPIHAVPCRQPTCLLARVNEVAQLRAADVMGVDGVAGFL